MPPVRFNFPTFPKWTITDRRFLRTLDRIFQESKSRRRDP
jgi:hypothetical protein